MPARGRGKTLSTPMKRQPPGTLAAVASFALAVAASAFWLFVPTGASVTQGATVTAPPRGGAVSTQETTTEDGVVVRETITHPSGRRETRRYTRPPPKVERQTLLETENSPDAQIVGVLAFPLLLAGIPLALNRTRFRATARAISAALLLAGSLVAGFSIGLYYLPSALAMIVAAARAG